MGRKCEVKTGDSLLCQMFSGLRSAGKFATGVLLVLKQNVVGCN